MRKILTQKFWSQGTPLGSLGPGSQADLGLGPCHFQILVIWGPIDPPEMVAFQSHAKKLNMASSLVCSRRFISQSIICCRGHKFSTSIMQGTCPDGFPFFLFRLWSVLMKVKTYVRNLGNKGLNSLHKLGYITWSFLYFYSVVCTKPVQIG